MAKAKLSCHTFKMAKIKLKPKLRSILILTGLIFVTILSFVAATRINYPALKSSQVQSQKKFTPKEIPELAQILSQDQETRLLAGRKLVERVGVEEALEILEHSDLPHTGEGHLVVHQIGFYAFKIYGLDAILHCKDYFLQACYHGAIIEAASQGGFPEIAKMADRCKPTSVRYFQCAHAAGHAILAIWNYDLPQGLKTCDEIFEKESKYPEAQTSCHNGAFMENLFGVHDWGTTEKPKRDWLSEIDPYFPCNAFDNKYQKGCWLNQAARIYQMYNSDITKTARVCEAIGNDQFVNWCIDNLSRQIHALTNGQTAKVFQMCSALGDYWRESCIVKNAGSYYSVGDFASALTICSQIAPVAKNSCFELITSQLISDNIDSNQKRSRCKQLGGGFVSQCLSQI